MSPICMSIYLVDARHRWLPSYKLKPVETQRRSWSFCKDTLTLSSGYRLSRGISRSILACRTSLLSTFVRLFLYTSQQVR